MTDPTTALIDADMLCFTFCASAEKEVEWAPDFWTLDTDLEEAKQKVRDWEVVFAKHYDYLCFCWSSDTNFRKGLDGDYKAHRAPKEFRRNGKPIGYSALRSWMQKEYVTLCFDGLEGDDAMGIYMSGESTVCLSGDKDMRTVPGYHAPLFEYEEPVWVSNEEADFNWHLQTLTGDTTDGYKGCPGMGTKTATEFLKDSRPWGQTTKGAWRREKSQSDPWTCIVSAYKKQGLSESHALLQARLARILRPGEYDFETNTPILWEPDKALV